MENEPITSFKSKSIAQSFSRLSPWKKRGIVAAGISIIIGLIILVILILRGLGFGQWSINDSKNNNLQESSQSSQSTASAEIEKKSYQSPLDGVLVTKKEYQEITSRSVLGVVFDNHLDARPQAGLNEADLIYESIAEADITRFLVFYLRQQVDEIGPIRSARVYHLDWLSEFDALFAHVGGASLPGPADALGKISEYQIKDLDQFYLGSPTYWRGTDKLAPHNMYSSTQKLWDAGAQKGFTQFQPFEAWKYKEDAPKNIRPSAQQIQLSFGVESGLYDVQWVYEPKENVYYRLNGGIEQKDKNSGERIITHNVIIQFTNQYFTGDEKGHLLIDTQGEGKALIFFDGRAAEATWKKDTRQSRTKYYDSDGKEIEFNRGRTWIEVVSENSPVSY